MEVAENYHKKAEKALDSLWSEINYYLKEEAALGAVKVAAVAGAAYVGAGKQFISNQIGVVLWNGFVSMTANSKIRTQLKFAAAGLAKFSRST